MLLVEHDQPEPLDRREDGRARPDADARGAAAQPAPLVVTLARGELGVQHRDRVAEAVREAADDLRRQADLRHEHDHAEPALERRRRGAQVDLGLARAGDAVQQQRRGIVAQQLLLDVAQDSRLVRGQRRWQRAARTHGVVCDVAPHCAPLERHEPAIGEAPEGRKVRAGLARAGRAQGVEQGALAVRKGTRPGSPSPP